MDDLKKWGWFWFFLIKSVVVRFFLIASLLKSVRNWSKKRSLKAKILIVKKWGLRLSFLKREGSTKKSCKIENLDCGLWGFSWSWESWLKSRQKSKKCGRVKWKISIKKCVEIKSFGWYRKVWSWSGVPSQILLFWHLKKLFVKPCRSSDLGNQLPSNLVLYFKTKEKTWWLE